MLRRSSGPVGAFALALVVGVSLVQDGGASPSQRALLPALSATFAATSYAPGQLAELRVLGHVHRVELQILRAGAERAWSSVGRPWGAPQQLQFRAVHQLRARMGGIRGAGAPGMDHDA